MSESSAARPVRSNSCAASSGVEGPFSSGAAGFDAAKGKALGMQHTTFHNASGLPDDGHLSSARDLAVLCRALFNSNEFIYLE